MLDLHVHQDLVTSLLRSFHVLKLLGRCAEDALGTWAGVKAAVLLLWWMLSWVMMTSTGSLFVFLIAIALLHNCNSTALVGIGCFATSDECLYSQRYSRPEGQYKTDGMYDVRVGYNACKTKCRKMGYIKGECHESQLCVKELPYLCFCKLF